MMLTWFFLGSSPYCLIDYSIFPEKPSPRKKNPQQEDWEKMDDDEILGAFSH